MTEANTARKAVAAKRAQRQSLKISDTALSRAKFKPRSTERRTFVLPTYPPGVVPAGHPTIAQDSAVSEMMAWANSSAFSEGQEFLGYAYLSELAQRPEYRRIVETIARNMTRRWIKLKSAGEGDKSERIAAIEAEMRRLGVQEAFRKISEQDGFFGRAHLYLDFGTTDDREELQTPIGDGSNGISKAKIVEGSLKRIKPVEAVWCYPTNYNSNDPLKPDWYRPPNWMVMGKELHSSRLLTFISREVPDMLKPAYSFGGLAMTQMAKPYVDNWLRTRQSVADIISAFSVFVLKTNLTEELNGGNGENMFARAQLFNDTRDNRGLMMIDMKEEDFLNVSASLATLDALQAQAQEQMASVSGIPIIELLGIQPAGLNASSEGEMATFRQSIHAAQETHIRPNLTRVINFIQLSKFGDVDASITFDFEPLKEMDLKELAEIESIRAQTDAVLVDAGVIQAIEVRKRLSEDEDSPYRGLAVDDVPLPPPSEAEEVPGLPKPEDAVVQKEPGEPRPELAA